MSDQGVARFDFANADPATANAARHDPGLRDTESYWSSHIQRAVKAVDDADDGVKIALEAVVIDTDMKDGTFNGFNSGAKSDVEEYEAEHAKEIATRINGGEKVSAADMAELKRTFRDNADNKEFSRTFLNSLGADNTLKFTNRLSGLAYSEDKDHKKDYLGLQKGLATTLATATKDTDSKFYRDFRADLQKAGVQKFTVDGLSPIPDEKVRGYQSLVTLMQQGDGYSGQFLKDVAGDIRKAEESYAAKGNTESIWALRDDFSGKDRGWFANDPLDGVLDVMSEDPKTSTAYLDPAKNDNLQYLMHERDWSTVIDGYATPPGGTTAGMPIMADDADARSGLGLALEAGTTGREPNTTSPGFGHHSEAQARIMHDAINYLDYGHADGTFGEDKDDPRVANADNLLAEDGYAAMREPLARALADYAPDTVGIIDGSAPGGRSGEGDSYAKGDESQIQNSRGSLLRVMRGVSEADDVSNFEVMYQAQQGYMSQEMLTRDFPNDHSVTNAARKFGEVTGALNAVGGDVKMDVHDDRISEASDTRFYGYHLGGGLVTNIPLVGDATQRMVDVSLNEWLSTVQAEEGALTRDELSRNNDLAQDNLDQYFTEWGKERDIDSDLAGAAAGEAGQSYTSGREMAYEALRSRS
ncbi:hypothetical protein ACIBI4_33485 [Streptomyces sp. NPDC050418]|uniref:hypothetical protein n=1 Tax=Streptomyces sp. NPDC050418 TaxID=3365612 RepID=UPI00379A1992